MRPEKPSDLFDPDALLKRPGARLMVLAPHPDDESLAAGGLIQRALECGAPVSVVFATDGDNNPWPQRVLERRVWIGARQRAAWGARRRGEAEAALRALGAEQVSVHRLGWPDGGVTWKLLDDTGAMLSALRALLERERPSMLVLPDLVDRHPDHSAIHVLVEMVLQSSPGIVKPACLGYLLHGRSQAGVPRRAVFALDEAQQRRKQAAIAAHASQTALSRARMLRFAGGTETFVAGLDSHDHAGPNLPWNVGVRHPEDASSVVRTFVSRDGAVATSGAYERGDHIVDPHRRSAAAAARSATVVGLSRSLIVVRLLLPMTVR